MSRTRFSHRAGVPLRACRRWLLLAMGVLVAPMVFAQSNAQLDAQVDAAMRRYQLPGLAVGVVKDGEVIYRGVRGETLLGSGHKVDAATMFKVASNTKAMTGAMLARLVDQGKLQWDDPVVLHLPHFKLSDPWVTKEMQVRDLLIHNSGFGAGAGDLMLWPSPNNFTRSDVIAGLQYLKPRWSFRSRYAYDNTLYIVAGEVAAAAGGASYENLMQREVFGPLGMKRCRAGAFERDAVGNVAQPHLRGERGYRAGIVDDAHVPETPMAAAGGVRCSLDDMLTWAKMWLEPKKFGVQANGQPWLSNAQRKAVWTTHQPMPLSERMRQWDDSHFSAYGYGWRLSDVDGTWKVAQTGTLSGMYSSFTLLPEKGVGIVVMINGDAEEARTVLMQSLIKQFTHPEHNPGVDGYAALLAKEAASPASPKRIPDTSHRQPALPAALKGKLGIYRDPWFGRVQVCAVNGKVEWRSEKSPRMQGVVMRTNDRWLVDWTGDAVTEAFMTFAANGRMTMAKVDPDGDFSDDFEDLAFVREADCPAR